MIRKLARLSFDLGRVVLAELAERAAKRLTALIMQPPDIREVFADHHESIIEVSDEQLRAIAAQRQQMQTRARRRSRHEDDPPLEEPRPLVGSLEWRREQARAR